jgi:hypothetical protein
MVKGFGYADLIQELSALVWERAAMGKKLRECWAPNHLEHGCFQENLDRFGTAGKSAAAAEPAMAAQRLDRPALACR